MPPALRPENSEPPDLHAGTPPRTVPADTNHPSRDATGWTWPTVTLTCVLVLAALGFCLVLAFSGTDPGVAAGIALLLVGGIVICVLPSRSGGGSLALRIAHALVVLAGGKGGNQ